MKRTLFVALAAFALAQLGGKCGGGDGSGGKRPTIEVSRLDERCVPLIGEFPPGFSMMPDTPGHAVATQFSPASVVFLDLEHDTPQLLSSGVVYNLPSDSDGDGRDDIDQPLCEADPRPRIAKMGAPLGVSEDLAFVATSDFEQVLFASSPRGELDALMVTNPANPPNGRYHAEDYPMLPPEGESALRTAVSTRACVYLTDDVAVEPVDSLGRPVGRDVCCDRIAEVPSFVTRLTAGMTIAAGHLFVSTSNLYRSALGQFLPGTVLVYDYDASSDPPSIRPNIETPILFTTAFNPTGVTSYRNASGRELVIVSQTGAIVIGTGSDSSKTEAHLDVIDAASRRIIATIPLGLAGLAFHGAAIDRTGRIAIIGSSVARILLAVDLAPLDDPALFERDEVVWLDGSDGEFPDARIFTADSPFVIPARADGPDPRVCAGWTNVVINHSGRQVYASDFCDGTLSLIDVAIPGRPCGVGGPADGECCDRIPLPQACLQLDRIENVLAPFTEPRELHAPGQIGVRQGEPGADYSGPDVFFIAGLPEGQLCGVRIESIAPSR